jgi:hypothetical protein
MRVTADIIEEAALIAKQFGGQRYGGAQAPVTDAVATLAELVAELAAQLLNHSGGGHG